MNVKYFLNCINNGLQQVLLKPAEAQIIANCGIDALTDSWVTLYFTDLLFRNSFLEEKEAKF